MRLSWNEIRARAAKAPFESDRERVEHLFMLYEKMTAGLLAKPAKPKRRKKADA